MHNKINNNLTHGFSLIELMVVIAIIGVLSAVATPVYLSYMIKSNVSSALPILEGLKNKVSDYSNSNNAFPPDLAAISTAYSDSMINSINVTTGSPGYGTITGTVVGYIEVTFNSAAPAPTQLHGKKIALVAIEEPDSIVTQWKCVSNIERAYLPTACR